MTSRIADRRYRYLFSSHIRHYPALSGIPRNCWIRTFESWPRHRSEIKCPAGVIALAGRSITGNAVTIVRNRVTIRYLQLFFYAHVHARKDSSRVYARGRTDDSGREDRYIPCVDHGP